MISAIVLAAGKSTRIGKENKMLLPFGNSTIIETVVSALEQSLVDEIILVRDSKDENLNNLSFSNKVKIVANNNSDRGMTTSIQCGVKASSTRSSGFMICLGDMPLLDKNDYNLLINHYLDKIGEVILAPKNKVQRGNPVIFSHHFLDQIIKLESMEGCKPILLSFPSYVKEVVVSNNHFFSDIDTKLAYQNAQKDYDS